MLRADSTISSHPLQQSTKHILWHETKTTWWNVRLILNLSLFKAPNKLLLYQSWWNQKVILYLFWPPSLQPLLSQQRLHLVTTLKYFIQNVKFGISLISKILGWIRYIYDYLHSSVIKHQAKIWNNDNFFTGNC